MLCRHATQRNATQPHSNADTLLYWQMRSDSIALRLGGPASRARFTLLSCFAIATRKHMYHAWLAGWFVKAPAIGSRHQRAAELPSY